MRAVAPTTSTLRSASSPARVIPPSRTLPAVEWSLGISPIQAANRRPDRNDSGAGVSMVSNVAPIGPAGNLRQAPATLIGAVPGQELDLEPGQELDLDSHDLLAPARTEVLEERDHLPVPQLPAQ